jgi:hypothetical protein
MPVLPATGIGNNSVRHEIEQEIILSSQELTLSEIKDFRGGWALLTIKFDQKYLFTFYVPIEMAIRESLGGTGFPACAATGRMPVLPVKGAPSKKS